MKIACAVLVAILATGCTHRSTTPSVPATGPSYLVSANLTKPPFSLVVEIRGADGKVRRVVSKGTVGDGNARWSPTGSMLAWADRSGLHVARGDGSQVRLLVRQGRCTFVCAGALSFAWSPNGRKLLVGSAGKEDTSLLVVDARTAKAKSLVAPHSFVLYRAIDWSRDGSWITYSRSSGEPGTNTCCDDAVYVSRPDGSRPRRVIALDDPIHDTAYASLSPDSRSLAVSTCCDARPQLRIVDVRNGRIRRIRSARGVDATPQWSPDSKLLAVGAVVVNGLGRIVRTFPTGADVRRWTRRGAMVLVGTEQTVLVSPDGRKPPHLVFRLPPGQGLLAIDAR